MAYKSITPAEALELYLNNKTFQWKSESGNWNPGYGGTGLAALKAKELRVEVPDPVLTARTGYCIVKQICGDEWQRQTIFNSLGELRKECQILNLPVQYTTVAIYCEG